MAAKMKEYGYYRGVNLGGWLSQCDYSQERLDHFIEKPDIEKIASWGLDHVRIPVDYNVLENEDGSYKEDGFARIEKAIGWCREYGLKTVVDLHKTAGYSFDFGEKESGFFESEKYQERFYRLWEEIARHFGAIPEQAAFELLNEVTDPSTIGAWNRISQECIRRIRAIAPDTLILVGSYNNNSAEAVPELLPPADDKVVYNFHCYEPLAFTHQGAYWVPWLDPDKRMTFAESGTSTAYFEKLFGKAIEKAEQEHTSLYCGEYGVIDLVAPEEAIKWQACIHETFEKFEIARCLWSYKEMDFGLTDARMDGIREEYLKLL